jgi:hypothetical protein
MRTNIGARRTFTHGKVSRTTVRGGSIKTDIDRRFDYETVG